MNRKIPPETKFKHIIADASLESCASFLSNENVQSVSKGLAERALLLLDYIYIPDERDGVYDISHIGIADERIPFIVAQPGETIAIARNPERSVHPAQWKHIISAIQQIDTDEINDESVILINKWLAETAREMNGEKINLNIGSKDYAFVYSESVALNITQKRNNKTRTHFVTTRPIMIANAQLLARPEAGSNLYHELIHDIQMLRGDNAVFALGPQRDRAIQRTEFEAYSYQAEAEEAYYGIKAEDNPYNWNSFAVESIRRRVNQKSKDPYKSSRRLMSELARQDIRIQR